MKMETEITVLVKSTYNDLKKELEKNGFQIKEEYELRDDYMINNDIDLSKLSKLEILQNCILVRDIVNIKKELLYKYKKYASNGDILEQGKIECPVADIDKAVKFMESINYKKLFNVFVTECKRYGILYKMDDIIKAYKKDIKTDEQISLF